MDAWGWIFLGLSAAVMGLGLVGGRRAFLAAAILFLTCAASNIRHVYLVALDPESVYAVIDLCGGLATIEVIRGAERGRRRWLAMILGLFAVMMLCHLAVWLARYTGGVPEIGRYRLLLSVLFAFQLVLAAIPGGRIAFLNLSPVVRHGPRPRTLQA